MAGARQLSAEKLQSGDLIDLDFAFHRFRRSAIQVLEQARIPQTEVASINLRPDESI